MIDIKVIVNGQQSNIVPKVYDSAQLQDNLEHSGGISLSWKSKTDGEIPMGSYVTYNGLRYILLDPYAPSKEGGPKNTRACYYKYDVQFKHPQNMLEGIPFWIKSQDAQGSVTNLRTTTYTGYPYILMQKVVEFMAEYANEMQDHFFAETVGLELKDPTKPWAYNNLWQPTWTFNIPFEYDPITNKYYNQSIITVSFDGSSLKSAIDSIADAMSCNVFWDWNYTPYEDRFTHEVTLKRTIRFVAGTRIDGKSYNCYNVLGGTKNMGKSVRSGGFAAVTQRLSLGIIDRRPVDEHGNHIGMRQTTDLIFDDIYPTLDLYLSDVRSRECYLTDENGDFIVDSINEDEQTVTYKTFRKWYCKLKYKNEDYFQLDKDYIIKDKPLCLLFQIDYDNPSNMSGLVGHQFELTYFPEATKEWDRTDNKKVYPDYEHGFVAEAGSYRIASVAEGETILPINIEGNRLAPRNGDKVTLVNYTSLNTRDAINWLSAAAGEVIKMMETPSGEYSETVIFGEGDGRIDEVMVGAETPFEKDVPAEQRKHGPVVTAVSVNLDTKVAEVTVGSWTRKTRTGGTIDKVETVTISANKSTTGGENYSDGSIGDGYYNSNNSDNNTTINQTIVKPDSLFTAYLNNITDVVACDVHGKVKLDTDVITKIICQYLNSDREKPESERRDITAVCDLSFKEPWPSTGETGHEVAVTAWLTNNKQGEEEVKVALTDTNTAYDLSESMCYIRFHFPQGFDMAHFDDKVLLNLTIGHPLFTDRDVSLTVESLKQGVSGSFKSRVFARTNVDISHVGSQISEGTYLEPWPNATNPCTEEYIINEQTEETTSVTWHDGVPQGDEKLWSTVCTFYGDGTSSGWSDPAQETDTATLDIEFSPNATQPEQVPYGTAADKDTSATKTIRHQQGWYDPNDTLPQGVTWDDIIWRAERKISNGVYDGEWTITRIKGEKGDKGGNTATVMLYRRGKEGMSYQRPQITTYYKFSDKKLYLYNAQTQTYTEATVNDLNGWSLSVPVSAVNEVVYVTSAIAYSDGEYDDIVVDANRNEWVEPVQFTVNGINTATVFLYQRASSAPTIIPQQTLYYKFSDGELYTYNEQTQTYTKLNEDAQELKGWKLKIPDNAENVHYPCWVIQAAALNTQTYDPIDVSEWSTVRRLVMDGENTVRIDLDNENDSMLYSSGSNTPVSGSVTSTAYMYDGSRDVSASTTFSITGSVGCTAEQATINGRVITVTGINATTASVTVQGFYTDESGHSYTKSTKLTIKKIVDGDKYDLVITPNSIAYNATTDNPPTSTIAIQVWKTSVNSSGGATRALSAPVNGYYVYANGTKLTASSIGTYSYETDNSAISEVQVKIAPTADSNDCLDAETIPINKAVNGQNVVRMDLDNEFDSIQYQGDGKTKIGGSVSTTAYLFDGVTNKSTASSGVTFEVDTANTTIASTNYALSGTNNRVLTVSGLHTSNQIAQDGYVTLKCTYNGTVYRAKFTVAALINQDKYDLDVNPNALSLNTSEGWSSSKSITIKVMRTPAGGGTPTAVNPSTYGLALSASVGTLGSYSGDGFTLTVTQTQATNNNDTVISLYKSGDTSKVYDRETIPFNKAANGEGIRSADVVFALNQSGTTAPDDTASNWKTLVSQLSSSSHPENDYLWQATKVIYTISGNTAYTGKVCLGKMSEFASVTEQYALGTQTQATGTWQDNTPPAPSKGSYLWTRTKLVYTSGNNKTSYVPSEAGMCIGYWGVDGTGIQRVTSYYAKQTPTQYTGVPPTTGWESSIAALGTINDGDYLWTKNVTTYTDTLEDTVTYTVSKWGIDGNGIYNIETKFYESDSLLTNAQLDALAESVWKETYSGLALNQGDYIYTRTKITYDRGSTPTISYTVNRLGINGVAYVTTEEYYCLGTSNTTPPDHNPYTRNDGKPESMTPATMASRMSGGLWSESRPTYDTSTAASRAKKYLWNFEVGYDTTSYIQVTQPICIANYEKGVSSIVELYAISAYDKAPAGHDYPTDITSWTDEAHDHAPTDEKPYQWNKTVTTYTDGSVDTFYHVSGVKGTGGQSSFKSTVFCRTNETPIAPDANKGSYANPNPPESGSSMWPVKKSGGTAISGVYWHDGIPSGSLQLWASTRIFTSDGLTPQQASWTTPKPMTDTADFDVCFSSLESPGTPPNTHPSQTGNWTDTADETTIWMATSECHNGVWSAWQVSKIKGETGDDGTGFKKVNTYVRHYPIATWESYIRDNETWSLKETQDGSTYCDNSHINIGDTCYIVGKISDVLDSMGNEVDIAVYGVCTGFQTSGTTRTNIIMDMTHYIRGGQDGQNSVRLALDNEHEDFLYDGDTLIAPSNGATSQIRLYDGREEITSFTPEIHSFSGTTQSNTGAYINNRVLYVKSLTAAAAEVVVKTTYNGSTFYAKFTGNKTNQDKYDLVVSPSSIPYNPANYPSGGMSITCSATGIGIGGTSLPASQCVISTSANSGHLRLFWQYVKTDGTKESGGRKAGDTFVMLPYECATYAGLYIELRYFANSSDNDSSSNYRICDYETVEIAKSLNGADGKNSVRLDLDNEMDMVRTDEKGMVLAACDITSVIRCYDGATEVQMYNNNNRLSTDATSVTVNGKGFTLKWSFAAETTISKMEKTVSYVDDYGTTHSLKMTIVPSYGQDIYQCRPNPSAVKFRWNDSEKKYNPDRIIVYFGYTKDGNYVAVPPSKKIDNGHYIYFRTQENDSSWYEWQGNRGCVFTSGNYILGVETCISTASQASEVNDSNIVDREFVPALWDGQNGINGEDTISIDLDNQADIIACHTDGKVRFARDVTTVVRMRKGSRQLAKTEITAPTTTAIPLAGKNANSVTVANDGMITVTWKFTTGDTISSSSYEVSIPVVYNGTTYSARFTLGVTNDVCIYQLATSIDAISFSRGIGNTLTPSSIQVSCGYTKTDADGTSAVSAYTKAATQGIDGKYSIYYRYRNADGTSTSWTLPSTNTNITVSNNTSYSAVEYCLAPNTGASTVTDSNIVDIETVPITKDGMDGKNSIRLALDNEHEDFLYSKDGLVSPSGGATSQAHLYDGPTEVTSSIEWRISDNNGSSWGTSTTTYATASINTTTGLLTISDLVADSVKIKVRAKYNNLYYYAEFTANKTNQDKYDIVVKPNAIAFNSSTTWTDKTISITAEGIDAQGGKLTPNISNGYIYAAGQFRIFWGYVKSDGKIYKPSATNTEGTDDLRATSKIVTSTEANNYIGIYFELRLYTSDSEYRLCDYETVEIAKTANGANGTDGADAVTYEIVFSEAWAKKDNNGEVRGRLTGNAYKIEGTTRTALANTTIRMGYTGGGSGGYTTKTTDSNGTFSSFGNSYDFFIDDWDDTDTCNFAKSIYASIIINNVAVCTEYINISFDGQKGDKGLQGCVVRVSEYETGHVGYRNDEGKTISSGTVGYIDVVGIEDSTDTYGYKFYRYKSSTESTSSTPAPPNSTYWEALTNVGPIYTSLLVAKYGYIKFGTGNQFVITNNSNEVQAGMKGDSTIRIWAGANPSASSFNHDGTSNDNLVSEAPFRVYDNGHVVMTSAEVAGTINASTIKGTIVVGDNTNAKAYMEIVPTTEVTEGSDQVYRADILGKSAGIAGDALDIGVYRLKNSTVMGSHITLREVTTGNTVNGIAHVSPNEIVVADGIGNNAHETSIRPLGINTEDIVADTVYSETEVTTKKVKGVDSEPVAFPSNIITSDKVELDHNLPAGTIIFAPNCQYVKSLQDKVYASRNDEGLLNNLTTTNGHKFGNQASRIFVKYSTENWKEFDCQGP